MEPEQQKILAWLKSLGGMSEADAQQERARVARDEPVFAAQVDALVNAVRRADEASDALHIDRDALMKLAQSPRIQHVAQLLTAQGAGRMGAVLSGLGNRSPALAEAIRMAMFSFEDLIYADNRGLQNLIARIDRKTLRFALRKTDENVLERFYSQMSQRSRETMEEEIEAMGRTRRSDVEDAQRKVLREAKDMIKAGEMVVIKPNDVDEWV